MSQQISGRCDKCGQEVPMANDATIIESIAFNRHGAILFIRPRHFLPVNGCEGSPSRAQYIEGQPSDKRGYKLDEKEKNRWNSAWAAAQFEYGSGPWQVIDPRDRPTKCPRCGSGPLSVAPKIVPDVPTVACQHCRFAGSIEDFAVHQAENAK